MRAYHVDENGKGYGAAVVIARDFGDALATWKRWAREELGEDDHPDPDPESVTEVMVDRVLMSDEVVATVVRWDESGAVTVFDSIDEPKGEPREKGVRLEAGAYAAAVSALRQAANDLQSHWPTQDTPWLRYVDKNVKAALAALRGDA